MLSKKLLKRLINSDPLTPIEPDLMSLMDDWWRHVGSNSAVCTEYGFWGQIWTYVDWGRKSHEKGPSCGMRALQFFGHLGEFWHKYGDEPLSYELVLPVLVNLQPEPQVVKFSANGCLGDCIEPTELGERLLKVRGRLTLSFKLPLFDIPQQYFDEIMVMRDR